MPKRDDLKLVKEGNIGRPPNPEGTRKGQIVSIRVEPEDNLRYTVATYLAGKNKSEHLLEEINKFSDAVEKKDPQRFKETLALFKKHRKAEQNKA
jgi:hypothetical protein